MRKLLLILFYVGIGFGTIESYAQSSNVIFFAEGGEEFTLVMNGAKKNTIPATRVVVTDLPSGIAYKANITLKDVSYGTISKTIYPNPGMEATVNIKMNKKGKYVLRFMGEQPISGSAQPQAEVVNSQPVKQNNTSAPQGNDNNTTTTTTTSSTTTTVGNQPTEMRNSDPSFSMNVNINDGTGGASMNVNINDVGGMQDVQMGLNGMPAESSTTTTTTTTTHSSTSNNNNNNISTNAAAPAQNSICEYPMNGGDYSTAKSSISAKSFDEGKVTMCKQIIRSNCPTSDQVKGIVSLLDFEASKLEVAKYAYEYCYDVNNYFKVNGAFDFDSSIKELDEYIQSR